jgi:hypothetical protein
MTDKEILTPGLLAFPNGGAIRVHSLGVGDDEGMVFFARRMPNSEEWECVQTSVKRFIAGVRWGGGKRAE